MSNSYRPQVAPKGYICTAPGCHAQAVITDSEDFYCASCALDRFDIEELPGTIEDFIEAR